jgi:hypothetical protein
MDSDDDASDTTDIFSRVTYSREEILNLKARRKEGRDTTWNGPDPEFVRAVHRQLKEDLISAPEDLAGYRLRSPISQDGPILHALENLDRSQSQRMKNEMQPCQALGLERKDGTPLRSLRLRSQSK